MRLISKLSATGLFSRLAALWQDLRGASLVQFIAVLPAFIVIIYGAWGAYVIMVAHHTLCDASWQATRYLQVEGPHFDEDLQPFPQYWEEVALDIAVDATAGQRVLRDATWTTDDITLITNNNAKPVAPQNPEQIEVQRLRDYHFTVRVTQDITSPLSVFFPRPVVAVDPVDPDDPNPPPSQDEGRRPGTIRLTCQYTGFMEGPPFRPTVQPGSDIDPDCLRCPNIRLPRCTPGPRPTACTGGSPPCPTPNPCDICCEPIR